MKYKASQTQEYLVENNNQTELTRVTTFVNSFDEKESIRIKCEHEEFHIDNKVIYKKLTVSGKYIDEMYEAFNSYDYNELIFESGSWKGLVLADETAEKITSLHLGTEFVEPGFLSQFKNLEELYIGGKFKSPLSFENLKRLKFLELTYSKTFNGLTDLEQLETLKINGWKKKYFELGELKNLKYLSLRKPVGLMSLECISKIPSIEYLEVYSAPELVDCNALTKCEHLKYLRLESCKRLSNLEFIKSLDLLELALLTGTDIESASFLSPLKHLKSLAVGGGSKFTESDISSLLSNHGLEYIRLDGTRYYKPKASDIVNQVSKKAKAYQPFQKYGLYI